MEELGELIELTSNRIYALRERLQEVLRQDFPSETPQLLGRLLMQLVDKVGDELNQLCRDVDASGPPGRRALSRYLRLYACTLRLLAPYIRYVEGARLEHNPWHIVGQFERLCRRIVPRARVIIRPRWKYNYSSCWLNGQLEHHVLLPKFEVKPIFDQFPNFFALSYTSAESGDILQYAIWGHEIGHLFSQELSARDAESAKGFSREISRSAPFDSAGIDELVNLWVRHRVDFEPEKINEEERERLRESFTLRLTRIRNRWLSEILADLFGMRLFGPALLFAFVAFPWTEDELNQSTRSHPAPRLRLAEMLKQLERLEYTSFFEDERPVSETVSTVKVESEVKACWRQWLGRLERMAEQKPGRQQQDRRFDGDPAIEEWKLQERLLTSNLEKAIPVAVKRVNKEIEGEYFCSPDDMRDVFRQVELLRHHLPPDVEGDSPQCLGLILTAGWLYWTTFGRSEAGIEQSPEELFEKRKRANRLLSKGIEVATIEVEFEERKKYARRTKRPMRPTDEPTTSAKVPRSGILAASDLRARLSEPDLDDRLWIMPLLEKDQVQADSIDLRLGNTFLVTRRTNFSAIDVTAGEDEFKERLGQYQLQIYVPMGNPFYIHPGQFVLASSLEFLSMPRDLAGSVIGRTSWGRLGISVPTTSKVAPGFKGCLTIEIKNLGETPVPLYPGVRIAQLRVQTLSCEATYHGRYGVPTSTQFSRIYEDAEMEFLRECQPPFVIGVTGLSKSGCSRVVNYLREEGFYDQSLVAIRREEMRRSSRPTTEEQEREYVLELRRRRGDEALTRLLLDRLDAMPCRKVVVEGIERLEEVELLAARTRFFLIGIEAPFERRLKWWHEDYIEELISEEELRKQDLWELYGVDREGEEPWEGSPRIQACLDEADYTIINDQDKAHIHREIEKILARIVKTENLYGFDVW